MQTEKSWIRIWNERDTSIGGVGAEAVISTVQAGGMQARICESEFKNHTGVEVPSNLAYQAASLIEKCHGRAG